ncbi:AAA family ATPase, partial [Photobacterium aphoticum]
MRTGASPYSLDLDSQIQLLSRLQFLTRFSSHLIQVTGPQGAGKTWLSQRYLEQWAGVPQQALLLCHPQQTDAQHRRFLLQQIAPKAVFNEQDPIVDSMERIFAHFAVNMVIVVDEAHHLSPAVVAELWALVQQARVTPNWQISVLLFGHSGRLETYLDKITYGQEQRPLEVEIAPLTLEEAQAFVDACVGLPEQDASQRRALKARIAECAPWPGALMQLEQGEAQTMEAKGPRRPSPLLIVIALMAVVAVAIGWLFMPADNTPSVSPVEETVALPDTVGDRIGDADSSEGNTVADRQTAGRSQAHSQENAVVQDDSASLPPEVHLEGLTVGRSDDSPRLVVPSDVVDAMLDEQSVGGSGEQSAAALTSETPPAEVTAPERQAPATERPEPKSAEGDTKQVKPSAVSPA